MSSHSSVPWWTFITAICQNLGEFCSFARVPRRKLDAFGLDLSLVALGIRSACLFDAFTLGGDMSEVFSELLVALRQNHGPFQDVVVMYDSSCDQYFFVKTTLLLSRLQHEFKIGVDVSSDGTKGENTADDSDDVWTRFIILETKPRQLRSAPPSVHKLLKDVYAMLQGALTSDRSYPPVLHLSSSDGLQPCDLIPFAAIVLEYPIAYVPATPDQTTFLSHAEIWKYEVKLDFSDMYPSASIPERPLLMSFTCPNTHDEITVNGLTSSLKARFEPRLNEMNLPSDVFVNWSPETFDRLAL